MDTLCLTTIATELRATTCVSRYFLILCGVEITFYVAELLA